MAIENGFDGKSNFSSEISKQENKEKIDLKILIAEDHPIIRQVLQTMLRSRYSHVESVEDGLDLLRELSSKGGDYNFIITDNSMLRMDGIEAVKKIREMGGRFTTIPIIMLSGDVAVGKRAEKEFNVFFLNKPADPDELCKKINEMAGKN